MKFEKNKKFIDPRYFLSEQKTGLSIVDAFISAADVNTAGDPTEDSTQFKPGTQQPAASGTGAIIERGRSLIGKGWRYTLEGYGGKPQGGPLDPKPDPAKVPMGSANATCDCTGFASWATGRWQKTSPWSNGLTSNLGEPASNPMPGDIIYRGPTKGSSSSHGHVGIVSAVIPEGATSEQINNGQADVSVIHCTSAKVAGGSVVENPQAIKSGWAGRGEAKVPVMFFRPTKIMDPRYLAGTQNLASTQQPAKPAAQTQQKLGESTMKHDLWDRMMNRLLEEQKIKEGKSGSKPDFLDLDKDGDKTEPMSKAAKEASGKTSLKSKKKKGKIPAQLRMHIKNKKKDKIDEEIERLENLLFVEGNPEKGLVNEGWGNVLGTVATVAAPYAIDWAMKKFAGGGQKAPAQNYGQPQYDEDEYEDEDGEEEYDDYGLAEADEDEEGDEEYGDESMESEEMSDMDSDGYEAGDFMEEGVEEYLTEAEVKKKKPRLGKVTRNPSGSKKKFHVYVKCGGRVKKISFGDPGLSIKRDSAARRKNFRARHKCDKPAGKDRCTARYWSCYQWRAGKKVEGEE